MKSKPISSTDIAKIAGVSQTAVSLVLQNKWKGRVGVETAEKILKIADQFNYRTNRWARNLRKGVSETITLVVPDLINPFFTTILRSAQRQAVTMGYHLVVFDAFATENWEDFIIDEILGGAVAGAILCATDPSPKLNSSIMDKLILIERSHPSLPSVQFEVAGGVSEAINYLISQGHEKIAHIRMGIKAETFRVRKATFEKIVNSSRNENLISSHITVESFAIEESTRAARALLGDSPRPTAIFCDDDLLAVGVYKAAKGMGIRIPEDLKVVGFNGSYISEVLEPRLTTVSFDEEAIGAWAVKNLIHKVNDQEFPQNVCLPMRLDVKGST